MKTAANLMLFLAAFTISTNGAELLSNGDFETGTLSGWYSTLMSSSDQIVVKTFDWGTDLHFYLDDGGAANWEVSLMQSIAVRAGYRYTITFGGSGIDADKPINFGINHNGDDGHGGDGSGDYTTYTGADVTLPEITYTEFSKVWDNATITDGVARIFINGGGNDIDFSIAWVSVDEAPIAAPGAKTRLSQAGFYTNGSKRIVVIGAADTLFQIRDAGGAALYSGTLGPQSLWSPSGETVRIADFSAMKNAATGTMYIGENKVTDNFTVSASPLRAVATSALKAFYYWRASTALTSTYAGAWARPVGHPDNSVTVHSSAGSGTISAPKGWYDAGDYGKYIINSGITVYTLLALYEHFPSFLKTISLTIPESGNPTPDILSEVRWNLEWMLSMQTTDGGVYSKLTPLQFDVGLMPNEAIAKRYVFMKTTPAALDFAAVMAMASRLYAAYDAAFAAQCRSAAEKAYAWASANPSVKYVQPADCNTGDYADDVFTDEFFWASIELALATGGSSYNYHTTHPLPAGTVPSWKDVGTLGLYTIVTNMNGFSAALIDSARVRIAAAADLLLARQKSGYGISMDGNDYYWGSNHVAISQGNLMLYAYYLTGTVAYRAGAEQQADYLLGRNPLEVCFVTGGGARSPQHPHHYISEADGVVAPVPGLLVGGPNTGGQDTASCGDYVDKPATSWKDGFCSYVTNEVAINWNAAFAYCVNSLEALHGGHTVAGFKKDVTGNAARPSGVPPVALLSPVRRGNELQFRITGTWTNPAHGECTVYDARGRVRARGRLISGADGALTVGIPADRIAAGFSIVRIVLNGETMQYGFIDKL